MCDLICASLFCAHGPQNLFQIATGHFIQNYFILLRLHLNSGTYTRLKSVYPNLLGLPKGPWSKQPAQFQSKTNKQAKNEAKKVTL